MNILCDYHHGDLYHSLHLLFEERLKARIFRPLGLEWFHKGFWKVAEPYGNAPGTIRQFLEVPQKTWKDIEPIQRYGEIQLIDGVYHIPARVGGDRFYIQKAITFNKFLKMDIDAVISTHPAHAKVYDQLVQKHKPKAIYIQQIGNISVTPQRNRNVLLATNAPMPSGVNYIKYCPEHAKEYCYTPPANHRVIKSFIANPLHEPDLPLFYRFEKALPGFPFKMHGILGRNGVISGNLMPQAMKSSAFIWHVKQSGGGGFVARQALACGRPCIIKKQYCHTYHSQLINLFQDSVNCVDLDLGVERGIQKIREWSQPDRHVQVCQATAEKFKRDVNFAAEAEKIKAWISSLQRK
jgi:hypothetical protein